jgi:hypothetical protein
MTAMSADNWVMGHGNEQLKGGEAFFKRVGPRALVAVVVSAVAAIVVWNVVRLARGQTTFAQLACIDPTDPCNVSTYRVTNDINRPVVLRECLHHCGPGDRLLDPITVGLGATTPDSVSAVTALVHSRDWWEVQAVDGRTLGCLVLDGHSTKRDGLLVDVSSLGRCTPSASNTTLSS